MLRFSIRSKLSRASLAMVIVFFVTGALAIVDHAWVVAGILIGFALLLGIRARFEATTSAAAFRTAFQWLQAKVGQDD